VGEIWFAIVGQLRGGGLSKVSGLGRWGSFYANGCLSDQTSGNTRRFSHRQSSCTCHAFFTLQ